jgi:hypothetical protein
VRRADRDQSDGGSDRSGQHAYLRGHVITSASRCVVDTSRAHRRRRRHGGIPGPPRIRASFRRPPLVRWVAASYHERAGDLPRAEMAAVDIPNAGPPALLGREAGASGSIARSTMRGSDAPRRSCSAGSRESARPRFSLMRERERPECVSSRRAAPAPTRLHFPERGSTKFQYQIEHPWPREETDR